MKMKKTGTKVRGLNNGKGKGDLVAKPQGCKSKAAGLLSCFLTHPNWDFKVPLKLCLKGCHFCKGTCIKTHT